MPAIVAQGLRKTYTGAFGRGTHEALRGLDLTIDAGTAFGLIGPNGAGKTTFVKTLIGAVRATEGTVRVLGGDPSDPAIRARLGYLPERLHLPESSTPQQFLRSVARLKHSKVTVADDRALLDRVGLADAIDRKIGGFSKGMRQRLGLAAALSGGPELLILDEPTDGIDPLGRVDVRRILAEERARGTTLLLNSHLLSETEKVCDRAGVLSAGRIVREGTLVELRGAGTRYRLTFEPRPPPELAASLGFALQEGQFVIDATSPAVLNEALDRARAAGLFLTSLAPETRDLEAVLAAAVEEAA